MASYRRFLFTFVLLSGVLVPRDDCEVNDDDDWYDADTSGIINVVK